MKFLMTSVLMLIFTGCTATLPTTDFSSENSISLRYSAYDSVPTLTAEAREIAIEHCANYGKFANYRGGNAANLFTAEEIHQFACERMKTDDTPMIASQSDRPEYIILW